MVKKQNQVQVKETSQKKPLRLWLGIVILILQWLIRFVIPEIEPDALAIGVFGGILGGLAIMIWWAITPRPFSLETP